MSGNTTFPILNPTTSLALVPPDIADQLEASRYLYVATLGAFVWDVLSAVPADWKLVTSYRIRPPMVAYFISRVFALVYILTNTVFQIARVPSCHALQVAIGWCWVVAVSSTSFLFYIRARAVFLRHRWAVAFFTFMYVVNVGASFVVPFAIDGTHIPGTMNCKNTAVPPWSASTVVISSCNDTFIFLAIFAKLVSPHVESVGGWFRSFWGARGLGGISRTLVLGGQQYYLITVAFNVLQMSMILTSSVPPILRAMFSVPNVAITNAMACRVYRSVMFESSRDGAGLYPSPGLMRDGSSSAGSKPNRIAFLAVPPGRTTPAAQRDARRWDLRTGSGTFATEITKTVETEIVVDPPGSAEFQYPPQVHQKGSARAPEWVP